MQAIDQIMEHNMFPADPKQLRCACFMLQRALCKRELAHEANDSHWWWAFCELFLRTALLPIPRDYRGMHYEQWNRDYAPEVQQYLDWVRQVHQSLVSAQGPKANPG